MSRKTYLTKEFFVDALEKQTKESVLSIPAFVNNVKLVAENKLVELTRFVYEQPLKKLTYYIDVSVLPLNEKYTRVCLHASYMNGQAFHSDGDLSVALHDFESAVCAALKGDTSSYKPFTPEPPVSKKMVQYMVAAGASLGVFFLRRKLS